VHEFLAIVTHPRIYDPPSSLEAAAGQVDAWLESPGVVLLSEGPEHWPRLRDTLVEARVMGPAVHDARIAAICAAHGIDELWSADRDFGRFSAVRTVNPLL
jgi:predicted nucleic acid-binding protein